MAYNQKIMRMKELIEKLTEADIAYYKNDDSIMTDREYDLLFDELAKLETETSLMMSLVSAAKKKLKIFRPKKNPKNKTTS